MEKYKKRLKEKDIQDLANFLAVNALGVPVVKTTTPTNATMRVNEIILKGDDLYIKFPSGKTKKFTGTDVS